MRTQARKRGEREEDCTCATGMREARKLALRRCVEVGNRVGTTLETTRRRSSEGSPPDLRLKHLPVPGKRHLRITQRCRVGKKRIEGTATRLQFGQFFFKGCELRNALRRDDVATI